MKRFHKGSAIRRAVKSVACVALSVAMVVPAGLSQLPVSTTPETAAEAADIPDPVMTLDFDKGIIGEVEKNGAEVKQYEGILQFTEEKENGNYKVDKDGNYIYNLLFDQPFIENGDYKYSPDGNQPTTYWDEEFGSVLMLDQTKFYNTYVKYKSDELDKQYPVYTGAFDESEAVKDFYGKGKATGTYDEKSVLQEETTTHSALTIKNPFAGMDFTEEQEYGQAPVWTKGVSISYWVKVPEYELTQRQKDDGVLENDSILFTFQNDTDEKDDTDDVYNLDDLMKYEACKGYDTLFADNAPEEYVGEYSNYTYTKDMYEWASIDEVTNPDSGITYKVISDYGPLVRFNKDYPGGSTEATRIYFNSEDADGISFVDPETDEIYNLKELGYNFYTAGFATLDISQGSLVKRSEMSGSLSIAASDSFAFKEDDYTSRQELDENGNPVGIVVQGKKEKNPNSADYKEGKYAMWRHYNDFAFQGDGTVTYAPNEWHFVTCVIMNDWVDFYVDGTKMDPDKDGWMYSPANGLKFSSQCAHKYFNKGWGIRNYSEPTVKDWDKDGTAVNSPSNGSTRTMLEWISDPDTKLMIGGQGSANIGIEAQQIGTADGAMLDDVSFYAVPLTEEQAVALYDEADTSKKAEKTATELKKFDFTADSINAVPAGMTAASTNGSNHAPEVVNDGVRGHVLKIYDSTSSATAGVVFDNPFSGKDLTGATVSWWYRQPADAKKKSVQSSIGITFNDEPKVLVQDKIQDAVKDVASRTGIYTSSTMDATFIAGYDTAVKNSLKNSYQTSTRYGNFEKASAAGYMEEAGKALEEYNARLQSFTSWHFVTMVLNNAGITMYYDGKQLPNNMIDNQKLPAMYGPRFFDGYYARVYDGFAKFKNQSNNQCATPLMTFLTQADTTASIGISYSLGSQKTFQSTSIGYYDNIAYYDVEMNADQVAELYKAEAAENVGPVAGEPIEAGSEGNGDNGAPTEDQKDQAGLQVGANGQLTATAGGVTVTIPEGAIDPKATLVVTKLGTSTSESAYANADSVLKGISGLTVGKRVLYDIHFELNGQVVQPTAPVTVAITAPDGYTASRCTVVYIDGKQVMGGLNFQTQNFGTFAVVEVAEGTTLPSPTTVNGNANTNNAKSTNSGSSNAGKTGDAMNVVLPILLLGAALSAVVIVRRKRTAE